MGVRIAAVLFFGLTVLGCADRPDPFRTVIRVEADSRAEARRRIGVRVDLVDGPPLPMARLLSQSVADELNRYDVPASTDMNAVGPYVLKGRTVPNLTDPKIPFIVLIHWSLIDRAGKAVGTHVQGVEGSRWQWEYGDPRIIRTAGKKAAKAFATMIHGNDDIVMPLEMHRAGIVVAQVEGAPGAGNEALTKAIIAALRDAELAITEDPRQAAFVLRGTVSVDPPTEGRQKVRIDWTVATFDGTRVGRATQENLVPEASLAGDWEAMAPLAAASAVEGIRVVLQSPAKGPRGRPVPPMPPPEKLPQVPGRAPPPE